MQKLNRVYLFDIEKAVETEFLFEKLPENERIRLLRFKHREDLLRGLFVRAQLYYAMYADFGFHDIPAEICRSKYGKPFVRNAEIYFSFSHSGRWAVCAVSYGNIGVDIEKTNDVEPELSGSICSPEELADFHGSVSSEKLCRLWTCKESYVKWKGTGFMIQPEQISITNDGRCIDSGKSVPCRFSSLKTDDDYFLTVCTDENNTAEIKLVYTEPDMIIDVFKSKLK